VSYPDKPGILHITSRGYYDLNNHFQKIEAAGIVYKVAQLAYAGSLGGALMSAERPYNWHPTVDGRSALAKELKAAEAEMWAALQRYDNARIAALKKDSP
jgi:hypothetical protein